MNLGHKRDPRSAHTARVRYQVGGREYEVSGPLFESGAVGPFKESNLTARDSLPARLIAPGYVDLVEFGGQDMAPSDRRYLSSCIAGLYPVGSETDVWYDLANPSRAYVERPVRRGMMTAVMLGGAGAAMLAVAAFLMALAR